MTQKNDGVSRSYIQLIRTFEEQIDRWNDQHPKLIHEISHIAAAHKTAYPLENPIVYNRALEKISSPRLIVVADNPGKDEQLNKNQKYLVGKSGVTMRNYLRNNSIVLHPDSQVVILNKTPIHTPSTALLKHIVEHRSLLIETEQFMARLLKSMHDIFPALPIWIIGMSEITAHGIFAPWRKKIIEMANNSPSFSKSLLCYKHFAYGNFSKEVSTLQKRQPTLSLQEAVEQVGRKGSSHCFKSESTERMKR